MAVDYKDYYQTLGVSKDASAAEIKRAFRKLAREHHPDLASDKKSGEEKFKEINEAYEVLGDPAKRKKYDELGSGWQNGGFGSAPGGPNRGQWAGGAPDFQFRGTGFSDFFEQFFGGSGQGGFGFPDAYEESFGGRTRRGSDIEGDLMVTLEEAMHGAVKPITLQMTNPSTGVAESQTFQVRIPPGVTAGNRIRVPGQGGPGSGGAEAGDLYLRIRLAAHPDFTVRGADIFRDLPLAPWEAVLGAEVRVPTLSGSVRLRIPPGAENGQTLRVRGRGLPIGKSGRYGDFHVILSVEVPAEISADERQAWENLRETSAFNPRHE